MCITPNFVWVERGPKWEQQPVACRQCWRCRQNRVNDYVARALAEAAVSELVCTVNLTYAPRDDLADKVLHPRHFQLFMKLLRRAGHKVRYLVAGEYGETKGRAHFHALLFFQSLQPLPSGAAVPSYKSVDAPFCREIPQKRMVHIREWPHGHVTVDWSASEKSARYVCKYLLADDKKNAWFSLSKKPPLGAAWFAQKAAIAKQYGVLPSSFEYLPPGGSKERPYLMTGATRRDYMNAISQDVERRGEMSEWVQKTFDKLRKAQAVSEAEEYQMLNPDEWLRSLSERLSDRALTDEQVAKRLMREDLAIQYELLYRDERRAAVLYRWGFTDEETFQSFLGSHEYFIILVALLDKGWSFDFRCLTRQRRFGGDFAERGIPRSAFVFCDCWWCSAKAAGRVPPVKYHESS